MEDVVALATSSTHGQDDVIPRCAPSHAGHVPGYALSKKLPCEVTIGLFQTYITFYTFSIHAMATVTTLPITIAAPATNWQKPAATGKIAGEFDEPPRRTKLLISSPHSRPNPSQSRSAFLSTRLVLPTSLLPGVAS
jgi:hypothetical protein